MGGSRLQTGLFGGLAFGTIAVAIAYIGPMLGYNAQAAAATVAVGLVALMIHSLRRRDAAAGGQRAVLVAGVLLICAGGIALAALVAAALLLRF